MKLQINGTDYNNFSRFKLHLAYDSIAGTFSTDLYFDPNNSQHRNLMRPFSYNEVFIEHNNVRLLTGYATANKFKQQDTKVLATLSGYSITGILEDSNIEVPGEQCDIQFENQSLAQITEQLLFPYALSFAVQGSVAEEANKLFTNTIIKPTQTIKEYLSQLATQRGIILTDDPTGSLVYTKPLVGDMYPRYSFNGSTPGVSMELKTNSQSVHSVITVWQEADAFSDNASQAQITNPYMPLLKSKIAEQNSGDDNDTELAAKMLRADQLKNITLTITMDRWELDGELLLPNTVIQVQNPEVFLFEPVQWFIREVTYELDAEKQTAVLKCVLPECFTLAEPVNIFAA